MTHDEKINELSQRVVKDNELIRKACYNLTNRQQKIIAYLISKIKPTDAELSYYDIYVPDFCALCGIDKSYFYDEIKDIIDDLDNKSFWFDDGKELFKFRWFSEVRVIHKTGKVRLQLNSNLKRYLLKLSENFTEYELFYIMGLRGKYSIKLYEICKSYSFMSKKEIPLEELKRVLGVADMPTYKAFKYLRSDILDKSLKEINEKTDINVTYEKVTQGKNVVALVFSFERKATNEMIMAYQNTINEINKRENQLQGQLTIYDYNL